MENKVGSNSMKESKQGNGTDWSASEDRLC